MAKIYRAWVGKPGGGGQALRLDGTIDELSEKPDESEFIDKPAGAPTGDFVQQPGLPGQPGEFSRIGRPGARTVRTEFVGEAMDRRNQAERIMAAQLGARMGAKTQLDQKGTQLGYRPEQLRKLSQIQSTRSKLEQDLSEGKLTPDQMHQFEVELQRSEAAILPQRIKRPPSEQEQFQQGIVTDQTTGIRYTRKGNGDWTPLSGGLSSVDRMKLAKVAAEAIRDKILTRDKKGLPLTYDVATAEKVNAWIKEFTQQDVQINAAMGGLPQQEVSPGFDKSVQFAKRQTQGTAATAAPIVVAEVDLATLNARDKAVVKKYKDNDNINWKWIEDNFGKEVLREMRFIVDSGNEQAIANALRRLKVI